MPPTRRCITGADQYLEGPTAVAFGFQDAAGTAKAILDYSKDQKPNNLPTVKAGVMYKWDWFNLLR
mgnify:CR=1 FL=1